MYLLRKSFLLCHRPKQLLQCLLYTVLPLKCSDIHLSLWICSVKRLLQQVSGRESSRDVEGGRERAFNLPVDVALHHERQADVGDEIITIIKPSVAFIKQLIWFDIVRWGIIRGLVKQLFSLIRLARSLPAGGKCFSRKFNLSERQESVNCQCFWRKWKMCVDGLTGRWFTHQSSIHFEDAHKMHAEHTTYVSMDIHTIHTMGSRVWLV